MRIILTNIYYGNISNVKINQAFRKLLVIAEIGMLIKIMKIMLIEWNINAILTEYFILKYRYRLQIGSGLEAPGVLKNNQNECLKIDV